MEEQKTQTFAEWMLDYVMSHPETERGIFVVKGLWGEFIIQIRDYSTNKTAESHITYGIYESTTLSFDELLIYTAQKLNEEIENYGK